MSSGAPAGWLCGGWLAVWLAYHVLEFAVMGFDGVEDSGYDEAGHHRVLCKWIM